MNKHHKWKSKTNHYTLTLKGIKNGPFINTPTCACDAKFVVENFPEIFISPCSEMIKNYFKIFHFFVDALALLCAQKRKFCIYVNYF